MPQPSPLTRPLAILALALPLLGGSLLVREQAAGISGPLAIAADGDRVAVAAPGKLYHLDGNGRLQSVDAGLIAADAREAGLAWLGGELLASPATDGALLRCGSDGCRPFSADPYAPRGPVQVGIADDVIWLAESGLDRIQRFRHDGRRLDMPVSDLVHPGTTLQIADQLFVCNSGIGKIERYTLHEHGVGYPPDVFVQFTDGHMDDPVNQPLRLLARPDGGFAALFRNAGGSRGLLADIAGNGAVMPRTVDGLVNPVALAELAGTLLVVDEDRMQVLQVAADGSATVFGDEAFNTQLAEQRQLRDVLRILSPVLLVLAALAAAIGGSLLLARLLARMPEGPRAVRAGDDGVAWLVPETALAPARVVRGVLVLLPAAVACVLAADAFGLGGAGLGIAVLLLTAAAVPPLRAAQRARAPAGLRIGLRGKQLMVADTENGMRQYLLSHVDWNERQLLVDTGETIPLETDGQPYFHRPTLAATLYPQLDPKRRLAG